MELHPELAGTPYEVLLGLLGRDIFALAKTIKCGHADSPVADIANEQGYVCASTLPRLRVPIAVQPFERGTMLWVSHPAGKAGEIYVVSRPRGTDALVWQRYEDTWRPGVLMPASPTPPPGLLVPVRGFGLLWNTDAAVREALGWATAPEQGDLGDIQHFHGSSGGPTALIIGATRRTYLLESAYTGSGYDQTATVLER